MRHVVVLVGLAVLVTFDICLAGPDIDSMALDENRTATLRHGVALLDSALTADDIKWLEAQLKPGNEPVNMLAAAILYKSDTAGYRTALFDYYSVDDYADRDTGKQISITQDDFVAAVGRIEKQVAEEFVEQNLLHLFGYWYFRDRNEWFSINNQTISAARFFRTSSLAAFVGLQQDQAVALAARIDRAAKAMSGNQ